MRGTPVTSEGQSPAQGHDDASVRSAERPAFDTSVAHQARMYDYWLGGKDNFAADRKAAEEALAAYPGMAYLARANRAFLGRLIRYLAGEAGVRQFLDVGTGIPTANNTHQVAQEVAPESRVVYVDYDPVVLTHARCWDVSSSQALTRNGGSDPVGIMSMITYAEQHYGGNPNRVYVTGASSGAMMTNVMLGDYPDVFKAGAAFMGVPFGCFFTGTVDGWNFPGDQRITNAWNATVSQSGSNVTATNASYDGTISPGGSVSIGFQGTWTGSDTAPTSFSLNGTACT